jgi:hypothetical protein
MCIKTYDTDPWSSSIFENDVSITPFKRPTFAERIGMSILMHTRYLTTRYQVSGENKRGSSAQAPTCTKLQAVTPPTSPARGGHQNGHPPSSPARLARRPHSDLLQIILEEGDPDRDSIPRERPYASMVPPTSPWNTLGRDMIGVHKPSGTIIPPTLISPERYKGLHAAHSQRAQPEAFTKISSNS